MLERMAATNKRAVDCWLNTRRYTVARHCTRGFGAAS
jgi:hypothetical protein